jgi:isoleucyl-tRNA synthetase
MTQLPEDPTYISHEVNIMEKWKEMNIYKSMVDKNKDSNEFIFMDGPPFVSGNLHPGHVAVSSAKSAIFIYKIMTGYKCNVKLGYDCHGLPAINKTAADNNLDHESISIMGIEKFNILCDNMITKYSKSWTPVFERLGRHADFDNVYMTRDLKFMESCFWIFKELWSKNLIYEGYKVMAYSYYNRSPLSNFEASQNYQEKISKSVYALFDLIDDNTNSNTNSNSNNGCQLIAWTTTPWTLVSNMALCVNPNITYAKVMVNNNIYILGKNSIDIVFDKNYVNSVLKSAKIKIIEEFNGSELVGKKYKPIYDNFKLIDPEIEYKILADSYVSDCNINSKEIGTAIVHLAPAFGDDDYRICSDANIVNNVNISKYCPIDDAGRFTYPITEYIGRIVFDCEDDIIKDLGIKNKIIRSQKYIHNYPYCWRSDTPLIYRTTKSLYVKVTELKDRMIELNSKVSWFPKEIGENRFHQWLKSAKDWAISRSTSYATPIPIWKNIKDQYDMICIGSIAELEKLSGKNITNLHPEYLNDLILTINNKEYKRIPDTFDCWFESGAVPIAQEHYPFSNESKKLETREFLSDFICEGMDQTRGWFYTLLILSTAIFNVSPYRNVISTGMILDKEGRKFSKKLGNFVDPLESIEKYGADVMRTYFLNSPVMSADCLKYDDEQLKKLKTRFTPYINGVKFMLEHTISYYKSSTAKKLSKIDIEYLSNNSNLSLSDKWIIIKTDQLVKLCRDKMEKFQFSSTIGLLLDYIDTITNWYIKFNRDRLKGKTIKYNADDWHTSLTTLHHVITVYCKLWTPFTPFLSEHIYTHINNDAESVLLADYPDSIMNEKNEIMNETNEFENILNIHNILERIIKLVRTARENSENHTKTIVPLKKCTIYMDSKNIECISEHISIIKPELNCIEIEFTDFKENVETKLEPNQKLIGQFYKRNAKHVVSKLLEFAVVDENNFNPVVTIDGIEHLVDKKFYNMIKCPIKTNENKKFDKILIDLDLMINIDMTYDEKIHNNYQAKIFHTEIQNMRKEAKLRPWDKVKLYVDDELFEIIDEIKEFENVISTLDIRSCNNIFSDLDILARKKKKYGWQNIGFYKSYYEGHTLEGDKLSGYIRMMHCID